MRSMVQKLLLLSLLTLVGHAATRSDINTIEAAEKLRYLSQKIAKGYLHLYCRPSRTEIKSELGSLIEELGANFTIIASSTKDSSTKDLLKYLEYSRQSMSDLLKKPITKNGSLQMLDYSEILLEGADSIAHQHRYRFNKEEAMLMNIKKYEYLVERIGKFYMASSLGTLSPTNQQKMHESTKALEEGLATIQSYSYPKHLETQKAEIKRYWDSSRFFLDHTYDTFIPNLLTIAGNHFEELLTQFALYHSKSQ